MSKQLPNNREKALAAIADGYGRTPTTAHPDCSCQTTKPTRDGMWEIPAGIVTPTRRKTCPIHQDSA